MIDFAKIDTTLTISGLDVHQPVTVLTDVLIAIICVYFFRILHLAKITDRSIKHWTRFFLFLGFASIFGAASHAFFLVHEGFGYDSFWLPMQLLNVFSAFSAQQATVHSILKGSNSKNKWNVFAILQLVLASVSVFVFHSFLVVVINSAIALIPVMFIHFNDAKKEVQSNYIGWGIVILFLTAIINGTKFSINEYFTYLDIAHVFITISITVMFVGIKRKAVGLMVLG